MRVENKMFYFDVGQNRRGVFMRVSEVSTVHKRDRIVKICSTEQIGGCLHTLKCSEMHIITFLSRINSYMSRYR